MSNRHSDSETASPVWRLCVVLPETAEPAPLVSLPSSLPILRARSSLEIGTWRPLALTWQGATDSSPCSFLKKEPRNRWVSPFLPCLLGSPVKITLLTLTDQHVFSL